MVVMETEMEMELKIGLETEMVEELEIGSVHEPLGLVGKPKESDDESNISAL